MLRVFFKSDKSSALTTNFLDIKMNSWSVSSQLLTIICENGNIRYYPLINVESFMEVNNES